MNKKDPMLVQKQKNINKLEHYARIRKGNYCHPFIYLTHHLHRLRRKLLFYLSLKIRQKSIS